MKDFQQRVVDEKVALDEKLEKLFKFVDTTIFKELPIEEQSRLNSQRIAMREYSNILEERIKAFES